MAAVAPDWWRYRPRLASAASRPQLATVSEDLAMPSLRRFRQVDVFGSVPYAGNPVAVVLDGESLTAEEMAGFTRWTNLSEATFVLPPTHPDADYRVRIFTSASATAARRTGAGELRCR
jgi:Phenazine biosynthesis-like protein